MQMGDLLSIRKDKTKRAGDTLSSAGELLFRTEICDSFQGRSKEGSSGKAADLTITYRPAHTACPSIFFLVCLAVSGT